jgi:hypothetical protein
LPASRPPTKRRGRPSRAGEPSTCRVEFAVTPAEYRQLAAYAARYGSNLADVARLIVLGEIAAIDDDERDFPR